MMAIIQKPFLSPRRLTKMPPIIPPQMIPATPMAPLTSPIAVLSRASPSHAVIAFQKEDRHFGDHCFGKSIEQHEEKDGDDSALPEETGECFTHFCTADAASKPEE